ncbi:hypothetical protein ACX8Z9_08570 [Arthrobacter halodurans]|uniref:Uncharacterized protein n=1 Tax=Arthrobacter halodurans TaxID=516699 RepID=A0ABV4UJR8_9MICC
MTSTTAVLAFQGTRGPSRAAGVRTVPSGLGAALIGAGSVLVAWGERIAARRAVRPRVDAALLERRAEFRRDAVSLSHSGLRV